MAVNITNDYDKFIIARWAYSVGQPIISDNEYMILQDLIRSRNPEDEYVNRAWSSDPCPTDLLVKYGLQHLAESVIITDKTESIPSINTWTEFESQFAGYNEPATLSMKHDGWNIQISYVDGHLIRIQTRGRIYKSLDMSALRASVPATIPWKERITIVAEATISRENFQFCRSTFGNVDERSAVHTVLSKPEYIHLIDLHAFDIHGRQVHNEEKFKELKLLGFNVPEYCVVYDNESLRQAIMRLSDKVQYYSSPTDGLVFDGPFTRALRLEAWEEPIIKSYVKGYMESYKIHYISPEIQIFPVTRKGGVQRRIAITNWQRIVDNNLRPGYPIAFRLASSATADFDEEATRLLQKEYEGNYERYRQMIEVEEHARKMRSALG